MFSRRAPYLVEIIFCWLLMLPATGFGAPVGVGVVAQPVQYQQIADPLEALGTLKANESVIITANVAESIESLRFESGQRVRKNDILVKLESAEERAVLEEAQYTLDEAQAQLDRIKAVARRGDASQSLLDEKQLEYFVAKARLAAVETRLQNRVVRAPFDGVVGLRNISPGAFVAPGDVITTLVDDSQMKLDFSVPSLFLSILRPGVTITARSRALNDALFSGVVASINNQVDPVSRSVMVRAILDNADGRLKPGLLMEVTLQSNPRTSLVISESALDQVGDQHFVYLAVQQAGGMVAQRQSVRIGVRLNGRVEILHGLAAEDMVIVDSGLKLQQNSPIYLLQRSPAVGE